MPRNLLYRSVIAKKTEEVASLGSWLQAMLHSHTSFVPQPQKLVLRALMSRLMVYRAVKAGTSTARGYLKCLKSAGQGHVLSQSLEKQAFIT